MSKSLKRLFNPDMFLSKFVHPVLTGRVSQDDLKSPSNYLVVFLESRGFNKHLGGSGMDDSDEDRQRHQTERVKDIYRNLVPAIAKHAFDHNDDLDALIMSPPEGLIRKDPSRFEREFRDYVKSVSRAYKRVVVVLLSDVFNRHLMNTYGTSKEFTSPYQYITLPLASQSYRKTENTGFKLGFKTGNSRWVIGPPAHTAFQPWFGSKDGGPTLYGFVIRSAANALTDNHMLLTEPLAKYTETRHKTIRIVKTMEQFKQMMRALRTSKYISIDTETRSLARVNSSVLTYQFACLKGKGSTKRDPDDIEVYCLPMEHPETPWDSKQYRYVTKTLAEWFETNEGVHVYANAKFDIHQAMSSLGIRYYAGKVYDVQAGEFSLEEQGRTFSESVNSDYYGLGTIELRYGITRPADMFISKSDRGNMVKFSLEQIADYGTFDVVSPLYIMFAQIETARKRRYPNFLKLITLQLGRMITAMTVMEHNGIPIDMDYLEQIASPHGELSTMIDEQADNVYKSEPGLKYNSYLLSQDGFQTTGGSVATLAGTQHVQKFSLSDNKQLQTFFFKVMGLTSIRSNSDGTGSLDKGFQKHYRHNKVVADYSSLQKLIKLKSAFATAILRFMRKGMDNQDGRLRPTFKYLGVLTGRSCFVGSTPVYVLDSRENVPIKDIKKGDMVWSVNQNTLELEPKKVTASWCVGQREVIEIKYRMRGWKGHPATTKTLVCTPDHPFMLIDGTWVEAQDLEPDDRLFAMERTLTDWGYRKIRSSPSLSGNAADRIEHRRVLGTRDSELHVHHIDEDKTNNVPDNLEEIDPSSHSSHHAFGAYSKNGQDNANWKKPLLSKSKYLALFVKFKSVQKVADHLGVTREVVRRDCKRLGLDFSLYTVIEAAPFPISEIDFNCVVRSMVSLKLRGEKNALELLNRRTCLNYKDISIVRACIQKYDVDFPYAKSLTDRELAILGDLIKTHGENTTQLIKLSGINRWMIKTNYYQLHEGCFTITKGKLNKRMVQRALQMRRVEDAARYLRVSKERAQKLLEKHNHTVVSSRVINGYSYVYDITVEDNNTFFANGVCVHNSTASPSTQQLPQHGKQAKVIKRQFCPKRGRVSLAADFSGHEVRVSGNLGRDPAVISAVDSVNKVWYEFRLANPERAKEMKETGELARRGDLHIANAKVFFEIDIEKDDPRRQAAKASVFAVTYGSKEQSMGQTMLAEEKTTKEDRLVALKAELAARKTGKKEKVH